MEDVMRRIMVQGDREAASFSPQVRQLGEICAARRIGLNVGESGEIVRILAETGADVRVHRAKPEPPNIPVGARVEVVDCLTPAQQALNHLRGQAMIGLGSGITEKRLAWAIRLAVLTETSYGFVFFPGREGTLAHLIPILAFIAKGERDKGRYCRRVALLGWHVDNIFRVLRLFATGAADIDKLMQFVRPYPLDQVQEALDWIADSLAFIAR